MSRRLSTPPSPDTSDAGLDCMAWDRTRLRRLRSQGNTIKFRELYQASHALRRVREDGVPTLSFDETLPITHKKSEIEQAIRDHQVVVVCGETGSGKSTQLPKFCLEIGRGVAGFIGHTQPRRVAARAIAERLAEELGSPVGGHAGYKHRFAEQFGDETYIKVLTDGMLLAELEADRRLERYDTLIIDEAHERSLNIDFLLGILKRRLPERPDLKVIITSATIDPEKFSRYFDGAPVIEVSGRTWPVAIRYRPVGEDEGDADERDLEVALLHAVDDLVGEDGGDILVFLPGEFHIHKTAGLLRKKHYKNVEILPLYARLPAAEQQRIFHPGGPRRIVLATNIAETSITVPGIRYVIDTGLARISRYRPAREVQALPIEPVSRASAQQRAGRCGRVADGICVRLYSEQDFESRDAFTPPEVQRTSLASVILTMHHLGLGHVEDFPFIEPPPEKMVKAGYRLLEELGAIDARHVVTTLGKRLARIPADPRIGRMLLAADEHRCASEVLTIAAALSIQDPRDYPRESIEKARQLHATYRHEKSDFLGFVNLWERYRRDTRNLSRRQRERYCRERYLSVARMREWRNVRDQLKLILRDLNIRLNSSPAAESAIHKALLAGLLGNIAQRHGDNDYLGTKGKKLYIHPSSALFKSRPKWLMCGELVQTSRLYARTIAVIDPKWVEHPAQHLVKRHYLEPYWDLKRGEVMAREQVVLFGLTLVSGRKTSYSKIDRRACREVFIRDALVTGKLEPLPVFVAHNSRMIDRATEIEHRLRRRNIVIDDDELFEFYDRALPEEIYDNRRLQGWIKSTSRREQQGLLLDHAGVRVRDADYDYLDRFPDYLEVGSNRLTLRYRFEPGHLCDGVTLELPAPLAVRLQPAQLSWLVPGLLVEKITALIRSLPKQRRRGLGPAAEAAFLCLKHMAPVAGESLIQCMSRTFKEQRGIDIPAGEWDEAALPDHLRMNIEIVDAGGNVLAHGRDLKTLKRQVARMYDPTHVDLGKDNEGIPSWVRTGFTDWSFGDLPETVEHSRSGVNLRSFVAVVDHGDNVAVSLFDQERPARDNMAYGLRRLVRLRLAAKLKYLKKNLPQVERMCLNFATVGDCDTLKEDIIDAALHRASTGDPWSVRSKERFETHLQEAGERLVSSATEICHVLAPVLDRFRNCMSRLDSLPRETRTDIAQQLDLLIFPGFVAYTPADQLRHLDRYLNGLQKRIARCAHDPDQDKTKMSRISEFWNQMLMEYPPPPDPVSKDLSEFRWMLEEFRISVFAQELKTAQPVSEKRLEEKWRHYKNLQT